MTARRLQAIMCTKQEVKVFFVNWSINGAYKKYLNTTRKMGAQQKAGL